MQLPSSNAIKNGKGAHHHVRRTYVQFCYLCTQFSYSEEDWIQQCISRFANL